MLTYTLFPYSQLFRSLGVDPQIGAVVAGQHCLDEFCLLLEIQSAQLVTLQQAERSALGARRRSDHQRGIVAILAFLRLIARPDRSFAIWPRRFEMEIRPLDQAVTAALYPFVAF